MDQVLPQRPYCIHNRLVQHCVAARCLLAALQQQPVAAAQRQRCNLRQGVWPRLKDDQQHANGCCLLLQGQACKACSRARYGKQASNTE
jgi:hypothetical protein